MPPADDTAGIPFPPPLIPLSGMAGAAALHLGWPLRLFPALPGPGLLLALVAVGIATGALLALRRHKTEVLPTRPTTALVTEGPFGLSRNPIYLAMVLLMAAVALAWGSLWAWLAVPAVLLALDRLVIAREEAYLAARFGAAYAAYCAKVRRWV
jgi:protein-S-isoprenylcysteine O-methyltransferase Ste14